MRPHVEVTVRCPGCDDVLTATVTVTGVELETDKLKVTLRDPTITHRCSAAPSPMGFRTAPRLEAQSEPSP